MPRDEGTHARRSTVGAGASPGTTTTTLLERAAPLAALAQAWASAQAHGGRIVLVVGEAGLGKSSLIQAFAAQLPDPGAVVTGWCDPMHTPRPLGPVRDLARRLLRPAGPDTDEARHFDGLLQRLAQRPRGPNRVHVLVLEDLHWIDQRSADWLQFVGRRLPLLPVLIVGSLRDDVRPAGHPLDAALAALPVARVQRLDLQPLSALAVRQAGAAAGLDADAADALHRLTAGHPYFTQELLQQRLSGPAVAPGPLALPRTLADALQARLSGLPPALLDLLALVACGPSGPPQRQLQRVASPEEAARIDEALALRLLRAEARDLQFRHELLRLAVLDRLPAAARRALHRRWLDVLLAERPDVQPLDLIVHHARGAGADEVLLAAAPRAAGRAAALGAHREAAAHLATAVEAAAGAPPEVAAGLLERWAYEASLAHGVTDRTIAARHEAVRLWRQVGRPDKVGENLAGLARMHRYRGESAQAQAFCAQAEAVLAAQPPSAAQAGVLALQAHFALLRGHPDDAAESCTRALAVSQAVGDVSSRSDALNTRGSVRMLRGDAGGETMLRESLALALQHGLHVHAARAYTNLAEGLMALGELARADAVISEGLAFDSAHEFGRWTDYLVGRQAQLRFEQERYAEALAVADGVLAQPAGPALTRLPALVARACAAMRLGRDDAATAMAAAVAAAQQAGESQELVTLHVAQIEAAVLQDRPAAARAAAQWLAAQDPGAVWPRARGTWRFWQRLAGVADVASAPVADEAALPPAFALAEAGRLDEAAAAFEAAGCTYLAAWARVAAARRPGGAVGDGRLRLADVTFGQLQAQAARDALRRLGVGPAPRAGTSRRGPYLAARGHAYGLTAREQQVLRLVAEGCDNATIAERLQRSRRTVENHVSAVLDKLQARNRLALMLRVQREPWVLGDEPSDPAAG